MISVSSKKDCAKMCFYLICTHNKIFKKWQEAYNREKLLLLQFITTRTTFFAIARLLSKTFVGLKFTHSRFNQQVVTLKTSKRIFLVIFIIVWGDKLDRRLASCSKYFTYTELHIYTHRAFFASMPPQSFEPHFHGDETLKIYFPLKNGQFLPCW